MDPPKIAPKPPKLSFWGCFPGLRGVHLGEAERQEIGQLSALIQLLRIVTFGTRMFWTAMQSSGLYRPSHLGLSRRLLDGRSIQNMSYIHEVKRQGHGTISHSSHCTFCHT